MEDDRGLPSASVFEEAETMGCKPKMNEEIQQKTKVTTKKFKRDKGGPSEPKQQWGPVLVEGRTRRQKHDGKSMLERARELKEKKNLERPKGIKSSNPFEILLDPEIRNVSSIVDVKLGSSVSSILNTVVDIQRTDEIRSKALAENCKLDNYKVCVNKEAGFCLQGVDPGLFRLYESDQWDQKVDKVGEDMEWTMVGSRKSAKKVDNDRSILEY